MTKAVGLRTEAGLRFAEDGVATPAEIPKADGLAREARRKCRFPVPVTLLAFDEPATDENDAVAVFQFEAARLGSCQTDHGRKQRQQGHRRTPAVRRDGEEAGISVVPDLVGD